MTLPSEKMQLRMFINLCNYAFDEKEPEFGPESEEKMLAALWEQFRVVFIQAKKRARINSINGTKGGRPKKPKESNWFLSQKAKKPTNTENDTYTYETSASADYLTEDLNLLISDALNIEDCTVFSDDLITNLLIFVAEYDMGWDEIKSYIEFVGKYSVTHCPNNRENYFYSVITKDEMYYTYQKSM